MDTIERIVDASQQILEELKECPGEKARILGCEVALIIPLIQIQAELDDKECLKAALNFAKVLLESVPDHLLAECDATE